MTPSFFVLLLLYHSTIRKTILPFAQSAPARRTRKNAAFRPRFPAFFVFIPYISMLSCCIYLQFALYILLSVFGLQLAHQVKKHAHLYTPPILFLCLFLYCIYHTTYEQETQYRTRPKVTIKLAINCAYYSINLHSSLLSATHGQKKTRRIKSRVSALNFGGVKPIRSCCRCPGTS